jgi:hypothetical protein
MSLVICVACRCHVRATERVCPHCAAELTLAHAVREPDRRAVEVRRVLFATTLAGLGLVGCGGRVVNEDVQGSCAQPARAALQCESTCYCGSGGVCRSGACVSCDCSAGEYCDNNGTCQASPNRFWFAGHLPDTGSHPCYGSPPLLDVRA